MKPSVIMHLGGLLLAAVLMNSCASSGPGAPATAYSGSSAGNPSAAPAAPRSEVDHGGGSAGGSYITPAQERRGLATGWGEERRSNVYQTYFVRASAKPAGTDVIYYNDPAGLREMSDGLKRSAALQEAANGLVEWGVKGNVLFLPTYQELGSGRRLVAGDKGSTYAVVVRNKSLRPLEVVLSVDGLDVMDGAQASFAKRGYIVQPGKTLTVDGFRTSDETIAQFRFSSVSGSYANQRHQNTRNVGIIGLAVFTQETGRPYATAPGAGSNNTGRGNARAFAEQ